MIVATLTEREVETVVRALKYWRSHRDAGDVRRADAPLSLPEFNLLLAKLGLCPMSPLRADGVARDLLGL